MNSSNDPKMEELFAPLREREAPERLRAQVRGIAEPASKPRHRRAGYLIGAACAASLALAVFVMSPRAQASSILERMANAVQGARSVHMRSFSQEHGRWVVSSETWYADGNWRRSSSDGTQVYGSGTKWLYLPQQRMALESKRRTNEAPEGADGAFRLRSSYEALNRKGFHFELTYGPAENRNGRTVVPVTVSRPGHDFEREVFNVDQQTDLPLNGESQNLTSEGWKPSMKWECEYNIAVPGEVFAASFPAGTRVLDQAAYVREWEQRLSKSIVSVRAGSDTVNIRDAFANSKGWVFLLWTGDIGGAGHRLFLHDDIGHEYVRACFNPGVIPSGAAPRPLLYVKGKLLDGAWFVPLDPTVMRQPRQFVLDIVRHSLPGSRSAGGMVAGSWFRRPFESSDMFDLDKRPVQPVLEHLAKMQLPALKPSAEALPPYLALFPSGPSTELRGERLALEARKHYWMLRMAPDSVQDARTGALVPPLTLDGEPMNAVIEPLVRGHQLPDVADPGVLLKLEALMSEMASLDRRINPDGEPSPFNLFELSLVERALGDTQAADKSLHDAERIFPGIRRR